MLCRRNRWGMIHGTVKITPKRVVNGDNSNPFHLPNKKFPLKNRTISTQTS